MVDEINVPAPKTHYMNFQFLRLESAYHQLMSNEKVVAKQEFLSAFDSMAHRMPIASYAMTGLKTDCDILLWRVSRRLEDLHAMSTRLHYSGLGKYLVTTRSFLGTVSGPRYTTAAPRVGEEPPVILGRKPYLIVAPVFHPTRETLPQNDPSPSSHLHIADATGLDDPDHIVAFETGDPAEFRQFGKAWKIASDTSTYTCILASIKEIIDSFG